MTDAAVHITVKGMVQGVGFRYFVYNLGVTLGLNGCVSNLPNGDVIVVAEGSRPLIEELINKVKIGPRAAYVSAVKVEWKEPEFKLDKFSIR